MVEVAEGHPSVGIVGTYGMSNDGGRWIGLPLKTAVFSGRELCRSHLLNGLDVIGSPTSLLYRADLIRREETFFPGVDPSGDVAACYKCLQDYDFGFVRQILYFERVHEKAISTKNRELNGFLVDRIEFLAKYGPIYLDHDELENRTEELLCHYKPQKTPDSCLGM